ncbi:hypothetical protein AVM02_04940 [Brucella anthropi]
MQQHPPDLSTPQFVRLPPTLHSGLVAGRLLFGIHPRLAGRRLETSPNRPTAGPNGSASDATLSENASPCGPLFLFGDDGASREAQETYGFLFCN